MDNFVIMSGAILVFCVILGFLNFAMYWWLIYKNKTYSDLFKAIGNGFYKFFDKIYKWFQVHDGTKTVYNSEYYNYSGTKNLEIPKRPATKTVRYEFVGWDTSNKDNDGNIVAKAIFVTLPVEYTVNIYDDDKVTLLKTAKVQYDTSVDVSNLKPQKPDDEKFTYKFVGFSEDLSKITENLNVYAKYLATPKKYTYRFLDRDGKKVIKQATAVYGTPIIAPKDPVSVSDIEYVYEFSHWSDYEEDMELTADVDFIAKYRIREKEEN